MFEEYKTGRCRPQLEGTFKLPPIPFAQALSADRGQLPQCLPELISPGCSVHLQDAPLELSRPTTQVAFPSRDPVLLASGASPSVMYHRLVPRVHESGRDHLLAY